MYGSIAKMRIKPGKEQELHQTLSSSGADTPGFVFAHVYRLDDDPQTLMLAVAFESRESYRANAESPKQHESYLAYRALLDEDPEWHDGEILFSELQQGQSAASD